MEKFFQKIMLEKEKMLVVVIIYRVNPLPDNKSLASSKLKAFSGENFKFAYMVQFFFDRVEKNVGKGGNAGCQHFLSFQHSFQKASYASFLTLSQTSPGFYLSAVEVF